MSENQASDTIKTVSKLLQSSSASLAHIEQLEQPSISKLEVITVSHPCNAPCCQDSLEVFQVTGKSIL